MGFLRPPKLDADGEAFAALYRRHFGLVWSLTLHLGVPPAAREDVAQEVWLAIHRRLHSLRPDASSRAWVASIARNVALHHHRTDGRRNRKHGALTIVTDICGSTHDADALASIEDALRDMDPGQREAFILIAVEELSGPEAAEVLGVPLNTVYSRLRLARARLARALTEIDDAEAAVALRSTPPQQRAAHRVWLALAVDFGWRDVAPTVATAATTATWTGKLAVVATSAFVTVLGTAALGGRGDTSAHAHATSVVVPSHAREPVPVLGDAPRDVVPAETIVEAPAIATASIAAASVATPSIDAAPTAAPPRAPTRRAAPRDAAVAKPEPPAVEATAAVDTLAAEAALLGRARRALSDGDPALARTLLQQHASEFPSGRLAIDRRATWVRMLCASAESAQARHELKKLVREHPTAPAVVAVRDVCSE
jgi:RNA polymerase sigma-70 factor (ECF subfamily)